VNEFVWFVCVGFSLAVGWQLGTLLIDMLSGLIFGDDEEG